jgi:hypothetical protein
VAFASRRPKACICHIHQHDWHGVFLGVTDPVKVVRIDNKTAARTAGHPRRPTHCLICYDQEEGGEITGHSFQNMSKTDFTFIVTPSVQTILKQTLFANECIKQLVIHFECHSLHILQQECKTRCTTSIDRALAICVCHLM